jgi:hypothetical protein
MRKTHFNLLSHRYAEFSGMVLYVAQTATIRESIGENTLKKAPMSITAPQPTGDENRSRFENIDHRRERKISGVRIANVTLETNSPSGKPDMEIVAHM